MPLIDSRHAAEVEALAAERFAAIGQAVLAALADRPQRPQEPRMLVSRFTVAQLALGPWRSRGEVRPAELGARDGGLALDRAGGPASTLFASGRVPPGGVKWRP